MQRRHRTRPHRRLGAVVVETAIVLPVFMMVVWGMVEFGRAMMVGQLTTNAARYGARQAILDGSTNSTVVSDVKQLMVETVKGIAADDVNVKISVTPGTGNQDPHGQLAATKPRDICKVSVSIPYAQVAYFSPEFLANAHLHAECAMRHE